MILRINGTDITPYLAFGGIKIQRNDVEGPSAGRTLAGGMERDRRQIIWRIDCTCRPLTKAEKDTLFSIIEPVYIQVETNLISSTTITDTFYSNNIPATFLMKDRRGTEYWQGITFPLIQRGRV